MKLSMTINYSGDFFKDVEKVQELEAAGLDAMTVSERDLLDGVALAAAPPDGEFPM